MFSLAKTFLFGVAFAACFAGGDYFSQYKDQVKLPGSFSEAQALIDEQLAQADAATDKLFSQSEEPPAEPSNELAAANTPRSESTTSQPKATAKPATAPSSVPEPIQEPVVAAKDPFKPNIDQAIKNNLQALENLRSLD